MAGKHKSSIGTGAVPGIEGFRPFFPGSKLDRAYSEGRQAAKEGGSSGDNPHPSGTPANGTWFNGLFNWSGGNQVAKQAQTCWVK